jgi:hypothetical protein
MSLGRGRRWRAASACRRPAAARGTAAIVAQVGLDLAVAADARPAEILDGEVRKTRRLRRGDPAQDLGRGEPVIFPPPKESGRPGTIPEEV